MHLEHCLKRLVLTLKPLETRTTSKNEMVNKTKQLNTFGTVAGCSITYSFCYYALYSCFLNHI